MNVAVSQTKNGWSNAETFLAHYWLTDDEDYTETLTRVLKYHEGVSDQVIALESAMRDLLYDNDENDGLWSDLLHQAFERIDWLEVVERLE